VVHRDLKPANVMLEDRRVVVLDFGIAKTLSADTRELTSQGAMIGTVEYMAPEQILGEAIDGKTDVYALGCLVYRMIARRLPYTAATLPELVHRHISSEPEPLAEVEGGRPVPPRLAALVLACLGKKREARPTMADVRDRLGDPAGAPIPEDAIPRSVPVPELLPRMVEAARPVVRTTEATGVHEGAPLEIEDRVASAPSQLTSRVRACPRCGVKLALYARGCHACGHSDDPFFTRMLPVEPEEGAPRNVALQFVHALPVAVHKRVFAGGLLVALLNAIFFHSSLGAYAVAAFLTAFGGLGLWLHRRR
jgi:hypothetical protein